jgi:hypothetical protein
LSSLFACGARKLEEPEKELTTRLDIHETAINKMLRQIRLLLSPPPEPQPPKKRIGFLLEEPRCDPSETEVKNNLTVKTNGLL